MQLLPLIAIPIGLIAVSRLLAADAAPSTRPTPEVYLRVAAEVEANLKTEILDKFFPVTADEQGAGFFENYGLDWKRGPGNNRSIVYQSRLTWTASMAARRFPDKAEMYLTMTRRGAACLADTLWDNDGGGFHWTINATGQPTSKIKQMYGHAFGIYALAASYEATKDQFALDLAKKAFQWLEDHAHDPVNKGYFENIGPDGKPASPGRGNSVGAAANQKSMNTSIHILEALTGLYEVWPDPTVKARIQEMLEICREKIYAEPGYLTQFLTTDWQRIAGPDSFGHDVEAGYLLVEAATALGERDDPRNWTAARHLLDHALQYGWDKERGGLYDSGDMTADGVVSGNLHTDKIWWVQAEQLNALLLQHEHVGNETSKYWDAFIKEWDWITKSQMDHTNGGWWPTVRADGTPASRVKADTWTECYHQARAMFNVSTRLRALAAAVGVRAATPIGQAALAPRYQQPDVPFLPNPATQPADWIVEHDPVTPNASPEARALLKYLCTISGKHTLIGQHNFPGQQNISTTAAARTLGKTPALYGTDWGFAAAGNQDSAFARPETVQELIRKHQKGSIITLCWHAVRPTEDEPVTFMGSVRNQITDAEWKELITPGTALHDRWIAKVDTIARYLKQLQDARVPILWRPFHEINGDWFWWNGRRGELGTKLLYRQMFDRMVHHHKLTNLIWVWNPDQPSRPDRQFVDYFPGQQYVDVLAFDCYGAYQQRFYDELNALSEGKPMGISETGTPPARDIYLTQPKWAYYMVWSGLEGGATSTLAESKSSRMLGLEDPAYLESITPIRLASGLPAMRPQKEA